MCDVSKPETLRKLVSELFVSFFGFFCCCQELLEMRGILFITNSFCFFFRFFSSFNSLLIVNQGDLVESSVLSQLQT